MRLAVVRSVRISSARNSAPRLFFEWFGRPQRRAAALLLASLLEGDRRTAYAEHIAEQNRLARIIRARTHQRELPVTIDAERERDSIFRRSRGVCARACLHDASGRGTLESANHASQLFLEKARTVGHINRGRQTVSHRFDIRPCRLA
jgi:hypothetical protein